MAQGIIDTRKNKPLMVALQFNILRLRASKAYRQRLTKLPINPGQEIPGIVHRTFRYRDGRTVLVTCHARVMVAYMRALKKQPTIEVTASSDSMYSGSFRTWEQQQTLYVAYITGHGHKAAQPGFGYHQTGRALDILDASAGERQAMLEVRDQGDQFYNGAVFGDPPHYSFGELG